MAMWSVGLFTLIAASVSLSFGQQVPDQKWGYVTVRPDAHMFWWLYGSTGSDRDTRPLVMWLQGGPGASSTGFGNFEELGPLDVNLQPRNTTWVQAANVLFVDNPVGTGYSYCNSDAAFATNNSQIGADLVTLFAAFLEDLPVFEAIPFYVFSESYGGNMAVAFGVALSTAIQSGSVKCNFQGVALGDSWISPIDSQKTWGPYLYATSLLNEEGFSIVQEMTNKTVQAMNAGEYANATALCWKTEYIIEGLTDNVDVYNILLHNQPDDEPTGRRGLGWLEQAKYRHVMRLQQNNLAELMNGPIRKKLGDIPDNVTWGGQAGKVFEKLTVEFMKDVIQMVDQLLANGIKVVVYNGQLDLIVDTMGTLAWIERLQWSGLPDFMKANRSPLYPPSGVSTKDTGAFLQTYENFSVYWILKSGHMVPADAGQMALEMLKMVTSHQ